MTSPAQQLLRKVADLNYIHTKGDETYQLERKKVTRLPLYTKPINENVNTRFGRLDINELLIKNPEDTFLIKVTGNSMIKAGINTGDILVVDRSLEAVNGNIVVATINDELLVKRLRENEEGTELCSENENFPNIKISQDDKFNIWGVVKSVIKSI